MTVILSTQNAIDLCNNIADKLDGGSFEIYDGARPANPATAITTQTLLGTGVLGTPAFGDAAISGLSAQAVANAIADITGVADGDATWARIKNSGGTVQMDCSVTNNAGAGDIKISNVTFAVGSTVIVISFNLRMPTGQ